MFNRRKKKVTQKIRSARGVMKAEGFNFDQIKRYFNGKTHDCDQIVSEQTVNDLDLDLLFSYIDRTKSKVGQQYLYKRLRCLEFNNQQFDRQERIISYFRKNDEERVAIQYDLVKLSHPNSYYIADFFQHEIGPKPKWFFIFPLITFSVVLSIILSFFVPAFGYLLLGLIPINVILHYGLKRKTTRFISRVPILLSLGGVAKKLFEHETIRAEFEFLKKPLATFAKIKRKMSFFKLEQKVDSDAEMAFWFILEFIKITFLLEPLLLFSSVDNLRDKSKDIQHVFEFVGEIDSALSIEDLRSSTETCIPTIIDHSESIIFNDLKHPLIPGCVPNDLNSENCVLITGSNMSGKTTYIRSAGISYITGHALNTSFSKSAQISNRKIHTLIRIEDDVMDSSSFFFQEIKGMKGIIESAQEHHSFVLLDELFKGTNTVERIAAGKSVLSYLSKNNAKVLVSTHDHELCDLLSDEYELYHFSEHIEDNEVKFSYQLKYGKLLEGNAINILEINDFPKEIISEAKRLAKK